MRTRVSERAGLTFLLEEPTASVRLGAAVAAARIGVLVAALLTLPVIGPLAVSPAAAGPLVDAPVVWFDDDDADIPKPEPRDPNLLWDGPNESFVRPTARWTRPSRLLRWATVPLGGDRVPPAADINRLDEVPNCSWFTNRIGLFPMTPEEVARGPLEDAGGPDRGAPWAIVSAKTQGVTPGFNIRDGRGDIWLIKFDPPEYPNMASAAGVISNRLLYAAGYYVPEDVIVHFTRDELVLGDGVQIKLPDGTKRPLTEADIDEILHRVGDRDGRYRAIASKFLDGKPIGPFDYQGRRGDDANDRIAHQDRRELRGLYTFAAWINHFDTKQHNSLDMYVEEDGRHFVRHHLIDFASTLGTGAQGPAMRWGYEYTIDLFPFLGRLLALGIHEDAWRRLRHPEGLPEIGNFVSDIFDPREFKPLEPNSAFANQTARDAYWAAKIISAFTDEQLLAAAEQGDYDDPAATRYMARILAERRDKIARCWFDKIPPLEFFRLDPGGSKVSYRDLGTERRIYEGPATYRTRIALVDADRNRVGAWSDWVESPDTVCDLTPAATAGVGAPAQPFVMLECQVDRGSGWSPTVRVYLSRASGRVLEVERG